MFKTNNFDLVRWMNDLISNHEEDDLLEVLNQEDLELQFKKQELSSNIEVYMSDILNSVPLANKELENFDQDVNLLKQNLSNLKEKVDIQNENMVLNDLHTIKKNLDMCCDMLEQATNWKRLVRETELSFSTRNLADVATKLKTMKQSMKLLENMPDHQKRIVVIDRMEHRLDSLLKPGLTDALQNNYDDKLKEFILVFKQLNRFDVFVKEYANFRVTSLCKDWFKYEQDEEDLAKFVSKYYDNYLKNIELEYKKCLELFQDSEILQVLIVESFEHISNSFGKCLSKLKDIESILHIYNHTCNFSSKLYDFYSRHNGKNFSNIINSIVLPYLSIFESYDDIETESLINTYTKQNNNDDEDFIYNDSLFQIINQSILNCFKLTEGMDIVQCLTAITNLFEHHIDLCITKLNKKYTKTLGDYDREDSLGLLQVLMKFVAEFHNFKLGILNKLQNNNPKLLKLNNEIAYGDNDKEIDFKQEVVKIRFKTESVTINSIIIDSMDDLNENFESINKSIIQLVDSLQVIIFNAICAPIDKELSMLSTVTSDNNFSGPSEYMTKVTDTLISLVQELDPFINIEFNSDIEINPLVANRMALLQNDLPFSYVPKETISDDDDDDYSASWLATIGTSTELKLLNKALQLEKIENKEQLVTDIQYLQRHILLLNSKPDALLKYFADKLQGNPITEEDDIKEFKEIDKILEKQLLN